jgi:predicted DCC family thiol-disulfide oxidoreductase YuxK
MRTEADEQGTDGESGGVLPQDCRASHVLVCGGRNFPDRDAVWKILYALREESGELVQEIVEGGA